MRDYLVVRVEDHEIRAYGTYFHVDALAYAKADPGSVCRMADSGEPVRHRPFVVIEVTPEGKMFSYGLYTEGDANEFCKNFMAACTSMAFAVELSGG